MDEIQAMDKEDLLLASFATLDAPPSHIYTTPLPSYMRSTPSTTTTTTTTTLP